MEDWQYFKTMSYDFFNDCIWFYSGYILITTVTEQNMTMCFLYMLMSCFAILFFSSNLPKLSVLYEYFKTFTQVDLIYIMLSIWPFGSQLKKRSSLDTYWTKDSDIFDILRKIFGWMLNGIDLIFCKIVFAWHC